MGTSRWARILAGSRRGGGFTLLELMVVILIMGLLAGLVGAKVTTDLEKSKVKAAHIQVEMLASNLDRYRLDTGAYPTTEQGLGALWSDPGVEGWDGPYLRKPVPLDPWRGEYHYSCPGSHAEFDLFCYGKDGVPGGEGYANDIVSWE